MKAKRKLSLVQEPVPATPAVPRTNAEKLAAAIEKLGPKWLLHKANRVKRLKVPLNSWVSR